MEFEEIDRKNIGDLKYLGDYIAFWRKEKGLSQRQLALYANISNTELHRIETAQRQKPSPKILEKIAKCLDLEYEELLQYAGYLDLQDGTEQSLNLNYKSLSEEEKNYILNYLERKWNKEKPLNSKHISKEDIEKQLFTDVKNLNNISKASDNLLVIPVIGKIAAGQPILAEEYIEGYLPVDPNVYGLKTSNDLFYLRVSGQSMNLKIKNGDYALIRKQDTAEDGDIIVAIVNSDDEATLKRYKKLNEQFVLLEPMSNDPSIEAITVDLKNTKFQIIGKAIGQFGKF